MREDVKQLDRLYSIYGYEIKENNETYRVYLLRQGVYFGVDIVRLVANANVRETKDEYSKSGYATREYEFKSIEDVQKKLFSGFFNISGVNKSLKRKYSEYKEKRTLSIGYQYEYIPCPYRTLDIEEPNENIINAILKTLDKRSPQLILIEAAAGFGKTSTAFEILNVLTSQRTPKNPIFTELSRNRRAQIFRYILLDEIDRTYPSLNSALVEYEIKSGRIPVIIDGFDELLQKSSEKKTSTESFEAVEAMLETIGDLLEENAKIILTSRRTAIFSGDEFHKWMDEKSSYFTITRFKIDRPEITAWIGNDRYHLLLENDVPIDYLCNPVLLSYIRSLDNCKFQKCCSDIEELVNGYFNSLLTREKDRQDLRIDVEDQLTIFKNLARDMASYNITSEEKSFISTLIQDRNIAVLEKIRHEKYNPKDRPKGEELITTLMNHALLDRLGPKEDNIGFINQFIFGYLLGCVAIEADDDWLLEGFATEQFISLASTAFRVRAQEYRNELYKKISEVEGALKDEAKLVVDIELLRRCNHSFLDTSFEALAFTDVSFGEECKIKNSLFSECNFKNVKFHFHNMIDVNFLNCKFEKCTIEDKQKITHDNHCWFSNCHDYNSGFISTVEKNTAILDETPEQIDEELDLEIEVLRQFWPKGRPHAASKRKVRTLFAGFKPEEKSKIPDAIKRLIKKGLIRTDGPDAYLIKNHMDEIQELLKH